MIDHLAIRQWVASLSTQAKPLARTIIGKAHQLFAESLAVAVRAGCLRGDPCVGVELLGVEQEGMRFPTPRGGGSAGLLYARAVRNRRR